MENATKLWDKSRQNRAEGENHEPSTSLRKLTPKDPHRREGLELWSTWMRLMTSELSRKMENQMTQITNTSPNNQFSGVAFNGFSVFFFGLALWLWIGIFIALFYSMILCFRVECQYCLKYSLLVIGFSFDGLPLRFGWYSCDALIASCFGLNTEW